MNLRQRIIVARIDFKYANKVPASVSRLSPWGEHPIKSFLFWPLRRWDEHTARRLYR